MTKIYLVRHAESEGNLYRRAHGQYDGQITGRGFLQIEQLKKRFENEKIDAVYSSDLSRTKTTAMSIYESHGLPLNTDKRLREVDVGKWEDTPWGDIEYRMPEMCGNFNRDPANWHVEGSEDYTRVQERMTECINEIAGKHDGDTIAVFSHGFAIRAFLCRLLDVPSQETHRVPYCDNTAVALLRHESDVLTIEYHGDNSHLQTAESTFAHQSWWRSDTRWKRENLRYLPFDEKRDAEIYADCSVDMDANKVFTAFLSDDPAGLVALNTNKDRDGNSGWIEYMYILPEQRRNGMGVQLIGQAVSVYRKLGRNMLRLKTPSDDAAISFCLKYGFTEAGGLMEKNISRNK